MLGEKEAIVDTAQILITTPGALAKRCGGRKKIDLSALKIIVYDEADELFI
jgi:superfamily II DNA/RNA helicase